MVEWCSSFFRNPLFFMGITSIFLSASVSHHLHAKVTKDAGGWTVVSLEKGCRQIFVAQKGKPSYSGESKKKPTTLAKAMRNLRSCDQILLKRGDQFRTDNRKLFPEGLVIRVGGKTSAAPTMIGSYGSWSLPRPTIHSGKDRCVTVTGYASHVVLQSFACNPDQRNPKSSTFNRRATEESPAGIWVETSGTNVLLEDLYLRFYSAGVNANTVNNLTVARCQILDSYDNGGNAGGAYIARATNVTFRGNIIDSNGRLAGISEPEHGLNHGLYIAANNDGVKLSGNIVTRSLWGGAQLRCNNSEAVDNLFSHNMVHATVGWEAGVGAHSPTAVRAIFKNNVGLNAISRPGIAGGGTGVILGNFSYGLISNNIFAHSQVKMGDGIQIQTWDNFGIKKADIVENLVYGMANGLKVWGWGKADTKVLIERNRFYSKSGNELITHEDGKHPNIKYGQNKYFQSGNAKPFSVSGREFDFKGWKSEADDRDSIVTRTWNPESTTIESYLKSIGRPGDMQYFFAAIRRQERAHWDWLLTAANINKYIRHNFGWPDAK